MAKFKKLDFNNIMSKTLFDKVWDAHVVRSIEDGPDVFFIDRHFIHEVTSPVAFLGLENRGYRRDLLQKELLQQLITIRQRLTNIFL